MLYTHPAGASNLVESLFGSNRLVDPQNSSTAWLIGTMFVTALVNWVYLGPQTTKVMGLRKHQETRDGKKSGDAGPHSEEMQTLNRQFGILHGASSLVNMVGLVAMIWYGGILGDALKL